MGNEITQEHFEEADYRCFEERLDQCLAALAAVLRRPDFGSGESTIGAELELDLVDAHARPSLVNQEVLAAARDPLLTVELDRFNLEINAAPLRLAGTPLSKLAEALEERLARIRHAAARFDSRVVTVGILPTLVPDDLQRPIITQRPRYRALCAGIARRRSDVAPLVIEGK